MNYQIPPYLLVATPAIQTSPFARSVILVVHADRSHVMGLILNRELSQSCDLISETFDVNWSSPQKWLHQGGPVQPTSVWSLHSDGWNFYHKSLMPGLGWSSRPTKENLKYLCDQNEKDLRVYLGYSQWGVTQLNNEFLRGSWITAPADPRYIFETPTQDLWEEVLLSLDIEPLSFVSSLHQEH